MANLLTDKEVLNNLYGDTNFAQSWADLQDGIKVKLVMYDDLGFILYRNEWIDCTVELAPGMDRPKLIDSDGTYWHDCLSHPYELEIVNK